MSDQAKIVLQGRIKTIFPSEVFGNFEKRVLWLEETTDRYPQTYSIEFTQGDVNTLDSFREGEIVECHINLRGRHSEKNGKEYVFNSLQCWRIKRLQQAEATPVNEQAPQEPVSDDLPF